MIGCRRLLRKSSAFGFITSGTHLVKIFTFSFCSYGMAGVSRLNETSATEGLKAIGMNFCFHNLCDWMQVFIFNQSDVTVIAARSCMI